MPNVYKSCLVCGKKFKVCNTCMKNIPEELQWRRVVCCPQHFAYHLPVIRYIRNEIDKNEAKSELKNAVEAFGEIEFVDNIKPIVEEILSD